MSRPRRDDLMQQIRDLQNEIEAAATRTGTSAMDPATQAPAASSRVTSANRGEPIDLTQEPSGRPHDAVDPLDPLARSSAAGNRPSARPSARGSVGRSQRASPRRRSRSRSVSMIPEPPRSPREPEFRAGPADVQSSSSLSVRPPWASRYSSVVEVPDDPGDTSAQPEPEPEPPA